MLRYFNRHYLSDSDLKILSKGLYNLEYSKLINYNDNFKEQISHEKAIRSTRTHPLHDEFRQLKETCKDTYIVFPLDGAPPSPKNTYPKNYEWTSLSSQMKAYIREQDIIAFNNQYRQITSGVDVEVYNSRLERFLRVYGTDYTDEQFYQCVALGYPIPTLQYKKAMDSARRAYKVVNGLVKANIHELNYFITLTFAPGDNRAKHIALGLEFDYVDGLDFENVKKAFSNFRMLLAKRLNYEGKELKYICVWEQTKKGNYHFHMITNELPHSELMNNPDILQYDTIDREYKKSMGLVGWKHGKSDYQKVVSDERMTTYISKYIIKSVYNLLDDEEELEKYKGKKKYFVSKNLIKPIESYEELIIEDYNDKFENETINPYNEGKIKRTIYTLIDNKKATPKDQKE